MVVVANSKEHAAVTYAAADEEPLGAVNGVGQCEMIPVMYINVINRPRKFHWLHGSITFMGL